jgi:hypothetical protein
MKILPLILFSFFLITSSTAQVQDLKIMASAGTSFQTGNFQLDWTLGESVILTFDNPPVVLTNGFHQPNYDLISALDLPTWTGHCEVFPNPCSDVLNIRLEFPTSENGFLELLDLSGKCFWHESFSGIAISKEYAFSSFPSGKYIVNLVIPSKGVNQNFSIVKL